MLSLIILFKDIKFQKRESYSNTLIVTVEVSFQLRTTRDDVQAKVLLNADLLVSRAKNIWKKPISLHPKLYFDELFQVRKGNNSFKSDPIKMLYRFAILYKAKKNMCVYCHMSTKSRVGRSGLIFFFLFSFFIIDKTGNSRSRFRNPIPVFNFRKFR